MNILLLSDYSLWWIPVILSLSLFFTWLLYFKKPQNDLSLTKRWILSFFRFLTLVVIGLLLLKPVIRTIKKHINKPIIFFAQDNSASVYLSSDSLLLSNEYESKVKALLEDLSGEYKIETISFGEETKEGLLFDYKDKATNFSNLFSLFSTEYYNQNIGALIIASDGIYNQGVTPEILSQQTNFPIYTIMLGDSIQAKDIRIDKVKYNRKVFKGSNTPVFVNLLAEGIDNQEVTLKLSHNGDVIDSKRILINENNFFEKVLFTIQTDEAGLQKYEVLVDELPQEQITENNRSILVFEVEDKRKDVLFIQNGWHPDVKVFSMAFEKHPAYKMQVVDANQNLDTLKLEKFDIVILHQLPSVSNGIQTIIQQLNKLNKPVLIVLGENSSIQAVNQLNVGLKISNFKGTFDNTNPALNENFTLFKFNDENNIIGGFPPLTVPFGELLKVPTGNVLFYQALGDLNTYNPLVFFPETGGLKIGVILGEGIWRWQLSEYANTQSHALCHQFILKSVQYLISEANKERFVVEVPTLNTQGEIIRMDARVYNASHELVTDPEVKVDLTNEAGEHFPYFFDKSNMQYSLNLKGLSEGVYTYIASTNIGNETFLKKGGFIVEMQELEKQNLTAEYNTLYRMSANSGGEMFDLEQMEDIKLAIVGNENIVAKYSSVKSMKDLTDRKFFFLLLVIMLTIEWFLRKLWGTR